jgi:hypothetical protein
MVAAGSGQWTGTILLWQQLGADLGFGLVDCENCRMPWRVAGFE